MTDAGIHAGRDPAGPGRPPEAAGRSHPFRYLLGAVGLIPLLILLVITILCVLIQFPEWDHVAARDSMRQGEQIIVALEAYRAQHAKYPERLEQLVPGFIAAIPNPTTGTCHWRYLATLQGFTLAFGCGEYLYPGCSYNSETKKWHYDS